jgi:putative ABC transport system permease protein
MVLGVAVTALGAAALLGGLASRSEAALPVVGVGGAVVFLGVTVLGPLLARPVSRLVGAPLAWLGRMPGTLARANALRNPKRTAATAAALMIGVGLVGFATIVAASSKASTAAYLDRVFTADFVVESGSFGPGGLSPDLAGRLERLPEVKAAAGVRQGLAVVDGARADLMAVDPASYAKIVDLGVTSGRLQDLDADGIAVLDTVATAKGWSVGDRVPVRFPETGQQRLTVAAIYHTSVGGVGGYLVGLPVHQANFVRQVDARVFVDRADGVSAADARTAIERVLADYPTATLQDQTEFKQAQATQIDQLLNFVYLLLGLAVVIALLGIANTLALSILERTRELGLLRAVGMTRHQLRATIRYEAVIIALFGSVLGLLIAVFLGWAMVTAMAEEQVQLAVPVPQLVAVTLAAALAGVLAAVLPARRASRLDVLAAIAIE